MRVPVSLATSLTMVLHELATNAAKHGALKSRGGKLKVGWRQDEHPQRGRVLHFAWDETISTLDSRPPTGEAGYGNALIDSTIANLRGYIERKVDVQGISVRFSLPVS